MKFDRNCGRHTAVPPGGTNALCPARNTNPATKNQTFPSTRVRTEGRGAPASLQRSPSLGGRMFFHRQELQFKSTPDRADAVYARKLQEVLGGQYGEITVAMQYMFQ